MNKEFENLFGYAKKLRSRYFNTLAAFKIYERFNKLSAPNIVGKKAEKNIRIFNSFKYFFTTTKEATRCYFLIELAKFFDKQQKSLTVYKVINYAEKNINKYTKEDFLAYHKDREILPELFAQYKQMSLQDLKKIKKRLEINKSIIKELKTYRNQYLAHDDLKKIKVNISAKEINKLLNLIKGIIGFLYTKLDFSVNSYVNFEKRPIEDLNRVVNSLINFERYKIKEFNKKYRTK